MINCKQKNCNRYYYCKKYPHPPQRGKLSRYYLKPSRMMGK